MRKSPHPRTGVGESTRGWAPGARAARLALAMAAGAALFVYGCENPTPIAPRPTREPSLAKGGSPGAGSKEFATRGKWNAPFAWGGTGGGIGIHLHLLPDGRVLTWGHSGTPAVYDPGKGTFTLVPSPTLVFCAGHAFLPDGRLLVTGGHDDSRGDEVGVPNVNMFDFNTRQWSVQTPLTYGRWYPTSTTLPNGDILTTGGTDSGKKQMPLPEVWSNGTTRPLNGARWDFAEATAAYYPRMFVAPDGRVFYAGEEQRSRWLDVSASGSWQAGPLSNFGRRDYGSAVEYDAGKIIILGGGYTPTNTVEAIDLNDPNPAWRYVAPMSVARRQLNATILADGTVLATGGTSVTGFTEESGAVYAAERWNPATNVWTTMASAKVIRVYHSAALLLPDGRVLSAGGGEGSNATTQLTAEIFSPPYLFTPSGSLASRPSITSAPTVLQYGQSFSVATPQAASIGSVTLIRLSSVTHAFNESQLLNRLTFVRTTGALTVDAPKSRNAAPPGPYMLFLLDANGVPSVARIVRLG